jgi:exosome complex component MTR3
MDCVDLVSGGIAAIIQEPSHDKEVNSQDYRIVLDPVPLEHSCIIASCVVGYLQSRDELTEVWIKGGMPVASPANQIDSKSIMVSLVDSAVRAASASRLVLVAAIEESVDSKIPTSISEA